MSDSNRRQPPEALVSTQAAETAASDGEGASLATPGPYANLELSGRVLDRYVIIERLGEGGMGVVYRAFDARLERQVALKLLARPSGSSGTADERFLREARALAKLAHPNVVTVHDAGLADGRRYIAMEYVDGGDLAAWLEAATADGKRDVGAIASVLCAAGRGLAAVHAAGLVHRDFKPANVFISRDGRAMVGDFGLVRESNAQDSLPRALDSGSEDSPARDLTATGAVMGTPAYMAPEQRMGLPVDARTDQYSFCVTFFEALTGRRPPEDAVDPAPLAEAGVPRAVRGAILRGLSRSASDRFDSMEDLLRELERPVRWPGLTIGAAGVALVGLLAYRAAPSERGPSIEDSTCAAEVEQAGRVWNRETRERLVSATSGRPHIAGRIDRYIERWGAARDQACRARPDLIVGVGSAADRCLDRGLETLQLYIDDATDGTVPSADASRILSDPIDCLTDEAVPSGVPLAALEQARQASVLRELGRRDEAIATATQAVELAGEDDYALASALLQHGDALGPTVGQQATTVLQRAYRAALRSGDLGLQGRVASALTWSTAASPDPARCETWSVVASEVFAASGDPDHRHLSHAIHAAQCAEALGRVDERREILERAAREASSVPSKADTHATLLYEMSRALSDQGDHERSIEVLLESESVARQAGADYGEHHRLVQGALAFLHASLGRPAQARYHLLAELAEDGDWHLSLEERRTRMLRVAAIEVELGDPDSAEIWARRSGCEKGSQADTPCGGVTSFLFKMVQAGIAEARGEGDEAEALYEDLATADSGADPRWVAGMEAQLEAMRAQLGRLTVPEEVLRVADASPGLESTTASKICWRAMAAVDQGELATARAQLDGLGD